MRRRTSSCGGFGPIWLKSGWHGWNSCHPRYELALAHSATPIGVGHHAGSAIRASTPWCWNGWWVLLRPNHSASSGSLRRCVRWTTFGWNVEAKSGEVMNRLYGACEERTGCGFFTAGAEIYSALDGTPMIKCRCLELTEYCWKSMGPCGHNLNLVWLHPAALTNDGVALGDFLCPRIRREPSYAIINI